jgi:5-methyltetrahydropteroyltriglutamate--homocysteine methyltransferase
MSGVQVGPGFSPGTRLDCSIPSLRTVLVTMLTTVVGDYPRIPNRPRPAKLRAALARLDRGEITEADLARVQDEVTLEVIDEQVRAGVDVVSDGHIRWEDEQTYVTRKLRGTSINGLVRYFDNNTYFRQPVVGGAIAWSEPVTVADYQFAAGHSPRPVKAVLTGPYTLARLSDNGFYASVEECALAYAAALHQEALALQEAGAPIIQLNEPAILKHKEDWPVLRAAVEAVFEGISAEKAVYTFFGDVAGLYPQMLELPCDILGLDFVSGPRNFDLLHGDGFSKKLGLGLVDARNTKLERVESLVAGIRRAAEIVSPEWIHLSPNCGLDFLPREIAEAKLTRMVEAAQRAKEVL